MTKQNQTITVNRLPAKTWNWLKMNETVIGMPRIDGSIAIKQSVAEAGRAEDEQLRMAQQTDWDKITTGMGEAMDQPSETDVAWDTELLTIPEHADCGEPYVYRFSYQSGQHAYNRLHIYAGAHSRAKVILLCESGETGGMISAIQTKVYAGEGAKVELYVVQTMNAEAVCLHDVGVSCEKDAAVKEVQLELEEAKNRNWDKEMVDTALTILDWSWEWGWDKEYGGIINFRDCRNLPSQDYAHDMKFWWPQTEAIIATLYAYQATKNEKYLAMHKQISDWTYAHFPDAEFGEWYGYLHRDGTISQPAKGNLFKGPFHIPRMMTKGYALCQELLSEK